MSDERFRRSDSERTGPIRNFWTTFRPSDGWSGSNGQDWTEPPDWMAGGEPFDFAASSSGADPVTEGVRMGYNLLEEQMRQGQQFARQWTSTVGSSTEDFQKIIDQVVRFYSKMYMDSTAFWFKLLFSMALPKTPPPAPPAPPPPPVSGVAIPVEVTGRGAAWLRLMPGAERAPLLALTLGARDPKKPPLTGAAFVFKNGRPVLQVDIPANQPPDLYLGVVCHQQSGEPLGTLAVQVREA